MRFFGIPNIEKMKSKKDVKGLVRALGYKKDYEVRRDSAVALGKIGEPAVEPLIAALGDNDRAIRDFAAEALGEIGDSRATKPLSDALKNGHGSLVAVHALGRIGRPATDSLIAVIKDKDKSWFLQEAAAKELRKIGDATVEKKLAAMLMAKDERRRAAAVIALGESRAEPFTAMLKSRDKEIRLSASEKLRRLGWRPDSEEDWAWYLAAQECWDKCISIGAPAAIPLSNALYDLYDKNVCRKLCHALISIGKPGTEAALVNVLNRLFSVSKGQYFNKELAECYLNCGNKKLENAARRWAGIYYDLVQRDGFTSGPKWGGG